MLEVKLNNSNILKIIFETIKDMVTDVNVECSSNGLQLQAMDSSHVSLVALKLESSGFSYYRCDKPCSLGLNMNGVTKVFRLCRQNDSVTIQADNAMDAANFVFEAAGEERISSFSLKLMSIDSEAYGIPDTDGQGDAVVKMPSKNYVACCKNIAEFSDTVTIEIDKNSMKFKTSGDMGAGEIVFKAKDEHDADLGIQLKVKKPVKQQFAVKYLNYFAKAASLSDTCRINLTHDHPIEVIFDIKDKNEASEMVQIGELKFFLAPKMDDGENEDDSSMAN